MVIFHSYVKLPEGKLKVEKSLVGGFNPNSTACQNEDHHPISVRKIIPRFETTNQIYPLVMTNIAMENGPFIDGLPIKNGDFPWLC
jgi:hypothetical protein